MRKMTLGSKLLVGGISLVLIPLITIGIYSFIQSSKALEVSAGNGVEAVAEGFGSLINQVLTDEVKLAKSLAVRNVFIEAATRHAGGNDKSDGPASDTSDMMNKELAALLKELGTESYETLVVINSEGYSIGDSRGASYAGLDLRERDYVKAAKNGKAGIGEPSPSRATGNPVVPIGAPIFSPSGQYVGAMGMIVKIDLLVDKICRTKVGKTGYAFMTARDGVIIAHPNKDFMFKRNVKDIKGMEVISARMLKGEKGFEAYQIEGDGRIAGFAPVTVSGWSVVASLDDDEFLAPVYGIRNGIVLVGAVFLVLAVLGSVVFSRGISAPIARVVQGLNEAAEQVRAASGQVASSSQQLAEGTSEQAAAVEETSSSLEEMSSMTRQNADNAAQANQLMREAGETVGQANRLMSDLTVSMGEISKASEETQKIIKTIDEIAFQTNLLALNAAVEAARAGEAGAGFAVVADEVRNLAMRAADAAKNTANLIEGTVKRVHGGAEVVGKTNSEFTNVAGSVGKSGELVGEIAAASQEQSQGIHQVNKAVAEMEQVIQRNAANAEESASAAEEMNAQAEQMKAFVDELAVIIGGVQQARGMRRKGKAMPARVSTHQRPVKAGKRDAVDKRAKTGAKEVPPEELIPFDEDGSVF